MLPASPPDTMTLHPLTVSYLRGVCERPGMFMPDFNLALLEAQLHGHDAALFGAGLLGERERFNRAFASLLCTVKGLSTSQGWAMALMRSHDSNEKAFEEFAALLSAAIPGFGQPSEPYTVA